MAFKPRIIAFLGVFLLIGMFVSAEHTPGHVGNETGNGTGGGQGGGLPGVVERVELVEDVLNVQRLERYVGPKLFVGATEYDPFDPGKVFVQLTQEGSPLENSTCFVSIWYPNTTRFVFNQMMAAQEEGIYYHDFTVPEVLGVFPVSIECQFFVSTISYDAIEATDLQGDLSGVPFDIHAIDGLTIEDTEVLGNSRIMALNITFTNTSLTNNSQFIFLDTFWRRVQGVTNDPPGDYMMYYVYNYSSGSYVEMAQLVDYTSGFRRDIVTLFNISDHFVGPDSTVQFLVNDTLGSPDDKRDTLYELDFFQLNVVSGVQNQTLENIRGGGEVHVTNGTARIIQNVTESPIRVDLEYITLDTESFLLLLGLVLLLLICVFKSQFYGYSVAGYFFVTGIALAPSSGWEFLVFNSIVAIATIVFVAFGEICTKR
jgi:hypothetical protein